MNNGVISRKDLLKITRGFTRFPDVASSHIYAAQKLNAKEAAAQMQRLAPDDDGVTKGNSVAAAYKSDGAIGFAMTTSRPNAPGAKAKTKDERIKAILFANDTDFFYGVWNLNKKTWKGRMRRAMNKSAKQIAGGLK